MRASCWLMVEVPPTRARDPVMPSMIAPPVRTGSIPKCEWKRRSSTEIIASFITCGISSDVSHLPKLGPSSTISVPSRARTTMVCAVCVALSW